MTRLIVAILTTMAVVAFGMANTHHVPVSFVFGAPVQIRQIFLLLTTVSIGVVVTLLWQQLRAVRRRRAALTGTEVLVRPPLERDVVEIQPDPVEREELWR